MREAGSEILQTIALAEFRTQFKNTPNKDLFLRTMITEPILQRAEFLIQELASHVRARNYEGALSNLKDFLKIYGDVVNHTPVGERLLKLQERLESRLQTIKDNKLPKPDTTAVAKRLLVEVQKAQKAENYLLAKVLLEGSMLGDLS